MKIITTYPTVRVILSTLLALLLVAGCATSQAQIAESPIVALTATSISRPAINFDGISFQYDPSLAARVSHETLAATARGGMFGTPSPAHTRFTFEGGPFPAPVDPELPWQWHNAAEILVYPRSGFGSQDWIDVTANERMHALDQLVAEQPPSFDAEFPALPLNNSAQAIHAQIRYLDFQNGWGVRFLTQYNQEARPINNQELAYVFQGLTKDGLHGVTAYFPVDHPSLPDGPQMSDADYQDLMQNLEVRLAEVTRNLNESRADSFAPGLALLDDVIQSLQILPTETDFPVRETEPRYITAQTDTAIFGGPGEAYPQIATLLASDTVLVTGESQNGDWMRVLCPDRSTGNCWLSAGANLVQTPFAETGVDVSVTTTVVAQVQLLVDSDIYNGPDVSYPVVGQFRSGEKAAVYSVSVELTWWWVECPAGIARNCWVPADPAITQPIAFSVGDGWQDITGNHVSYRVPPGWQPVAEEPGEGSVLEQWKLGIPGTESDQIVAFFAVPFDSLQPPDLMISSPFGIGGQPGAKWVRGGERTISYDYYTNGVDGAGSFGIHVTLPDVDPELEALLDGVAASVVFHSDGEDFFSPGANLPPGPRLVVQRPDNSIQYVTLDGSSATLVAEAPASLRPSGFGDTAMSNGPQTYVRQWWGALYLLDTPLGQLIPVDFVPSTGSPVAVRSLSEEPLPDGQPASVDWDISLAWGEFSADHTAVAGLFLSTQDGSRSFQVLEETYESSDLEAQFVPWRWSRDHRLFFTKQPVAGMGGFFPFIAGANLWVYDLKDGNSRELVSNPVTDGRLCLDAISPDDRLVAHHCDEGSITLLDLETGEATTVRLPDPMGSEMHIGGLRFSPDGSRIAFAVMTGGYGMIEKTQGSIAVSDELSGDSRVIATSEAAEWFSVSEWLWGDTLVLQSHSAGPDAWPAVWTVQADGSGLAKVADGTFLGAFQ